MKIILIIAFAIVHSVIDKLLLYPLSSSNTVLSVEQRVAKFVTIRVKVIVSVYAKTVD